MRNNMLLQGRRRKNGNYKVRTTLRTGRQRTEKNQTHKPESEESDCGLAQTPQHFSEIFRVATAGTAAGLRFTMTSGQCENGELHYIWHDLITQTNPLLFPSVVFMRSTLSITIKHEEQGSPTALSNNLNELSRNLTLKQGLSVSPKMLTLKESKISSLTLKISLVDILIMSFRDKEPSLMREAISLIKQFSLLRFFFFNL